MRSSGGLTPHSQAVAEPLNDTTLLYQTAKTGIISHDASSMTTKHLYNTTDGLVLKSLRGFVALNPLLGLHEPSKTVFLPPSARPLKQRVVLVAGGGAGHEPAHAGYVGTGMLSAAVCGEIFASPGAKHIGCAIALASASDEEAAGEEGYRKGTDVLVVINNYTGDRLNFGLAIEKARISLSSIHLESVIVADDVSRLPSIPRLSSSSTLPVYNDTEQEGEPLVGARGLGGNILVCKILGALASSGAPLSVVKPFGDALVAHLASIGVGLEHCHVPGHNVHSKNELGADQCEVGLGLHNEAGVKRRRLGQAEALVDEMVEMVLGSRAGGFIRSSQEGGEREDDTDEVILFVNNLGGMSQLEMGAVVDEVLARLARDKFYPRRIYSAPYMTSLNAPGFSISLLNVSAVLRSYHEYVQNDTTSDSKFLEYPNIHLYELLDAPTDALAWAGVRNHWPTTPGPTNIGSRLAERILGHSCTPPEADTRITHIDETSDDKIKAALSSACKKVLGVEQELTAFDTIVGDGDCGSTFASGAKALLKALGECQITLDPENVADTVHDVANVLEDAMFGTIGALFAIFLTALSSALRTSYQPNPQTHTHNSLEIWSKALSTALSSLSAYTPAKPGDRTIVDALHPFVQTLSSQAPENVSRRDILRLAASKALDGAEKTRGMKARLGRAAYIGKAQCSGAGMELWPPDPGAWGVAAILEGLVDGLEGGDSKERRRDTEGGGVEPRVSN